MIPRQPSLRPTHFIIIFLLVSLNLRMAFSAADPLLAEIRKSLDIGAGKSGLFGLLPVMALGIAAPMGARLVQWIQASQLVMYALLLALAGIIWRSNGNITGLFGGTILIGLGLGMAGSVMLGVMRQEVKHNTAEVMSAYTACVSLGTAIGAGAAEPVANLAGGWQHGLLFWGIPLLVSVILWGRIMRLQHGSFTRHSHARVEVLPLLKEKNPRMITLYYLFRVASAWLLIVWLAFLMQQRGLSSVDAGFALSLVTISQIPGAMLTSILSRWLGGIHRLIPPATVLAICSCWVLLVAPLMLWPWAAMALGMGLGCIFSIGMTLMTISQPDEAGTIALSGLAQGVGFVGGGLLAWGAGLCIKLPFPCIWMAGLYSLLSLCGLYFGIQCREEPAR